MNEKYDVDWCGVSTIARAETQLSCPNFRYVAICHPLTHYKIKDRKKAISLGCTAAIWVFGLLIGIDDAVQVRLSTDLGSLYTSFSDSRDTTKNADELRQVGCP